MTAQMGDHVLPLTREILGRDQRISGLRKLQGKALHAQEAVDKP